MYKILTLILISLGYFHYPHTAKAQLNGNWRYEKSCEGDKDLCDTGPYEVLLTFEGNLLGISYLSASDEMITRVIYDSSSDSVYFVDDSLEIAYIFSKQLLSNLSDSIEEPLLLNTEIESINGIECEVIQSQLNEPNSTIYHNVWVPMEGEELSNDWNFSYAILPFLNPLSQKLPLRAQIIIQYGEQTATIEYNLVESDTSPISANTLIHDGFKFILK